MIEAGDGAKHGPTGETWFILGVSKERDEVCVAGWPATRARLSDCVLTRKGRGLTTEQKAARVRKFGQGWDA
jgi:Arc/MetJ family transcription regulator